MDNSGNGGIALWKTGVGGVNEGCLGVVCVGGRGEAKGESLCVVKGTELNVKRIPIFQLNTDINMGSIAVIGFLPRPHVPLFELVAEILSLFALFLPTLFALCVVCCVLCVWKVCVWEVKIRR